jgi:hypothetical protein
MVVKKNLMLQINNFNNYRDWCLLSNIGKSNQEIAALSRSSHQSQGFVVVQTVVKIQNI